GMASIGNLSLNVNPADGKYRVSSATLKGTAAYEAGIEQGDYILKVGDQKLSDSVKLNDILRKYKPGQNIPLVFESREQVKNSALNLQESETLELVEMTNNSRKQIEFRNSWLSSKIK
ncbi:MAG: PDZ domain-containing protein, partial [Sediminibacterium sp.]|uniref:PDZ domain-containing protein n=1 Tax=Sediminibacterium sp. TaxID=1917865 RepID=UPI00271FC9EC